WRSIADASRRQSRRPNADDLRAGASGLITQQLSIEHRGWDAIKRERFFGDKLYRVEYHSIEKLSDARGKICCKLTTEDYKKVKHTARAAESLTCLRHDMKFSDAAAIGLTIKSETPPNTVEQKDVLDTITVDQVVYSLGQQTDERSEGTAAYTIQKL